MCKKLFYLLILNLLTNNILTCKTTPQLVKKARNVNSVNSTASTLTQITTNKDKITSMLKNYKVCGSSLCSYFNGAFIFEEKKLDFEVDYAADNSQNLKQRRYNASIKTIGCKSEFTQKTAMIFFVETDFNFYDSNKTIKIGPGLSLSLGLEYIHNYFVPIEITFAMFKNIKGGIIIVEASVVRNIFWMILDFLTLFTIPIGQHSILDLFLIPVQNIIPVPIRNHLKILGISLVASGHLTPFKEKKEAGPEEENKKPEEKPEANIESMG